MGASLPFQAKQRSKRSAHLHYISDLFGSKQVALHARSIAGQERRTEGTGLPPRPRLRPDDVPRLVYAALEQGIAAAQNPAHADADAATGAGTGATSAGSEPDELAGRRAAGELAQGADPDPDPGADPAGSDEGSKRYAAGAAPSAEALPVISEAIRTLQALGCAALDPAMALSPGASPRQWSHADGHRASTALARPLQAHPGSEQRRAAARANAASAGTWLLHSRVPALWLFMRRFHSQAVVLFEGLTPRQLRISSAYPHIVSSYLKQASGHFRGPTQAELDAAIDGARAVIQRQCAQPRVRGCLPSPADAQLDVASGAARAAVFRPCALLRVRFWSVRHGPT